MVLLVHGGPWARDVWGLYADHQWLANRGYAVLSVNSRGSTGFGKAFVNAANLEWAGRMHDDLIDAVDWAIAQGMADPGRVAIMGTSYGGYSALVAISLDLLVGLRAARDPFPMGILLNDGVAVLVHLLVDRDVAVIRIGARRNSRRRRARASAPAERPQQNGASLITATLVDASAKAQAAGGLAAREADRLD
jgi:dienelactone hydrolase